MDLEKHIAYWAEGVPRAWRTVPVLMEHGYYMEALFWAHLAVEKALKAHVVKMTGNAPPHTHNLIRLAVLARIELPQDMSNACECLMDSQVAARYGDFLDHAIDDEEAQTLIQQSEMLWQSLVQKL